MSDSPQTYYVRFDVGQHGITRFAGPFNTNDEAQAAVDTALGAPNTRAVRGEDQQDAGTRSIRIQGIEDHAAALEAGLREQGPDANVVGPIVPTGPDELSDLQSMPY